MEESKSQRQDDHKLILKDLPRIPGEIATIIGNWCVVVALIISYVPMHGWLLGKYYWPIWLLGVALSGVQLALTKNKVSGAVGLAVSAFAMVNYL